MSKRLLYTLVASASLALTFHNDININIMPQTVVYKDVTAPKTIKTLCDRVRTFEQDKVQVCQYKCRDGSPTPVFVTSFSGASYCKDTIEQEVKNDRKN
jgi:hypothetical protein